MLPGSIHSIYAVNYRIVTLSGQDLDALIKENVFADYISWEYFFYGISASGLALFYTSFI